MKLLYFVTTSGMERRYRRVTFVETEQEFPQQQQVKGVAGEEKTCKFTSHLWAPTDFRAPGVTAFPSSTHP